MKDIRRIENWRKINDNEYEVSLIQYYAPYIAGDPNYCGSIWIFKIQTFNNGIWFLDIAIVEVINGGLNRHSYQILVEEFYSGTNIENRKTAMRKAYNIAKAIGLVTDTFIVREQVGQIMVGNGSEVKKALEELRAELSEKDMAAIDEELKERGIGVQLVPDPAVPEGCAVMVAKHPGEVKKYLFKLKGEGL